MTSVGLPISQHVVYLSLGSNQGRRLGNIHRAIRELSHQEGIHIVGVSSIFMTSAIGFGQPEYLNAAVKIKTTHDPADLFSRLKNIEKFLGRKPAPRWTKRPIDIDIIFYGAKRLNTPALKIPHPQFRYRRFVLEPLLELAPRLTDPLTGKTVRQILNELTSPTQRARLYVPPKLWLRRHRLWKKSPPKP